MGKMTGAVGAVRVARRTPLERGKPSASAQAVGAPALSASWRAPTEYQRLQFQHEFWRMVGARHGMELRTPTVKPELLTQEGLDWRAVSMPDTSAPLVMPGSLVKTKGFAEQRALMAVMQLVLERNVSGPSRELLRAGPGGKLLWHPTASAISAERNPFHSGHALREAMGALQPDWPKHAVALDRALAEFPWVELERRMTDAKLPSTLAERARRNAEQLRTQVLSFAEPLLGSPEQELARSAAARAARQSASHRADVRRIKANLRDTFERNLVANTDFSSVQELKDAVMQVPEYRAFVEEFWSKVSVGMFSSPQNRSSILRSGVMGLSETKTSSVSTTPEYVRLREATEAAMLGMPVETYRTRVPPALRPRSAFLQSEQAPTASTQYGSDLYRFSSRGMRELDQADEVALSFSLGDSLNDLGWHSLPVPAADFPCLAAPFVVQARTAARKKELWAAMRYREAGPGLKAVLPQFKGDLARRLRVSVLKDPDPNVESVDGLAYGYIEAQAWGPLFANDADTFFTTTTTQVGPKLAAVFESMKVPVKTYLDRER